MYKDPETGKMVPGKAPRQKADGVEDSAYRQRARKEQERLKNTVMDDFWLCVCFKEEHELLDFLEHLKLEHKKHYKAAEFIAATERFRPEKVKRTFPRKPKSKEKTPNPCEGTEYIMGKLQEIFIKEADLLFEALQSAKRPDPCHEVTDSDIWFTVVFANGKARETYLSEMNLDKYGDRYMDGSSWLKDMTR